MFTLTVYGLPQPAGSKRAFVPKGWTRAVVTDANPHSRDWKNQVAKEAIAAMETEPLEGPLHARFTFFMPRPASHFRTGRYAGQLKAGASLWHPTGRPDTTKLVRAVEDALTKVVYRDDAQIVFQVASKVFTDGKPRVTIEIKPME